MPKALPFHRPLGAFIQGRVKGTPKNFCDKDFAELSGELSGAICLKTLALLGFDSVSPSNCSENSLALFVRFFGFGVLFGLLTFFKGESEIGRKHPSRGPAEFWQKLAKNYHIT